jgi:alanine racemase
MDREARVDLGVVNANTASVRERCGGTPVMAVVKQDAYGHGAVPCARAALAGGATWLGVAHVAEGLALRQAGLTAPVLSLMAVPGAAHQEAIRAGIDLTAGSLAQLEVIIEAARRTDMKARVQLKADTGLSRGGCLLTEWPELVDKALADENITVTGLWSHFACSDEPGHPSVGRQLDAYNEALAVAIKAGAAPEVRHIANTAAALTVAESWFDLIRIGGALYGLSTLPGGAPGWLTPAMSLRARLAMVKRVPAGTGVSYGHRYVTTEETALGLVPLGYADGIRRDATGKNLIGLNGRRYPIAGTVCMDQVVADLGDEPARQGDEVVLFGTGKDKEPTAHDWGKALGTISYEITTGIGARVPRTYPIPAELSVPTDTAMRDLGSRLAAHLRAGDLLILSGPLGAGKTTLTQGIGEGLKVRGPVTSPTFVISRVHPGKDGPPLVHADAYRLGSTIEVDDLDLDTANSVTVVEWGEGLADHLAEDRLEISIEPDSRSSRRTVRIKGHGLRWDAVLMSPVDRL